MNTTATELLAIIEAAVADVSVVLTEPADLDSASILLDELVKRARRVIWVADLDDSRRAVGVS